MRRTLILPWLLTLAACASAPPPAGTLVSGQRIAQSVVPGVTTRAQLLAALGKTKAVVFDSGYEAWLYEEAAGADRYVEHVVLLGPDGLVKKKRRTPLSRQVLTEKKY